MPTTLIVDRDPAFGALCSDLTAADEDYRFVFAADDAEAVARLREEGQLDLAVVSIDTPGISGMDLFRMLEGRRIRVPRVALASRPDLTLIRDAMNRGAADFLVKPVAREDLRSTIARVYALCEERRQAWRNEARLAALRREIELAKGIQRRILPSRFPPRPGLEIAARLCPAEDMSGDFYDVFELDGGRLGIAIADVTGHGIPAAFLMAVVQTLLRAVAAVVPTPHDAVREVNDILCRHRIPSMLVSLFFGVLDTANWRFTYTNGGHPSPLCYDAASGDIAPLNGGKGVILGAQDGLSYVNAVMELQAGDALLMFTDGVLEANRPDGAHFSLERVAEVFHRHGGAGPEALSEELMAALAAHQAGGPQRDDMAVMALRRRPPS